MTNRERVLAAVRGDPVDRMPWVPRLEFWHRARLRSGALPAELRSLSLVEISDRLGSGHYHVIPDFTDCPRDFDMLDRALGIFNLPVLPYRVTLDGVDRRVLRHDDRETILEYHTPVGSLRTATIFTDEMLDGGSSMSWITEHPIREPRDFETVGYIFSHLRVEPQFDGYLAKRDEVGDRGIVIGYTSGCAGPLHHIMKELMPMEQFFYALHDYPAEMHRLADQIEPFYARILEIAAASPAEVVLYGGNYDDSITYPAFFRKYILPRLRDYAGVLHGKGKYLLTHTDGENRKLLPLYREANFDVADSVCPHPMTSCTLEELRQAFAGRIAIWGGIPSVLLCPDSATTPQFRSFIDDVVARYGRESRFILGVSDMVPSDAEWDRMQYITEKVTRVLS
mgnify:CR=1 FL=1